MNLKFKRLHEAAQLPTRGTTEAAGLDLYATEDLVLLPGIPTRCGLGVAVEIPHGYAGFLFPRSGLGAKHGIGFPNGVGLIDSDYRGEIAATLVWGGHAPNTWAYRKRGEIFSGYKCFSEINPQESEEVAIGAIYPHAYKIRKGDRIAQLVIAPVALFGAAWADELSETERAGGGFGSTGK